MKNLDEIDAKSIPGAVIDPATGRFCALQADIARALECTPGVVAETVRARKTKVYQEKFLDILHVIAARKQAFPKGRRPHTYSKMEVAP